MLFEDPYPPFGDAPYPASIEILEPLGPRDRLSIALRLIYVIPHIIVLLFVILAWGFTTIAAWFVILFTGTYPKALYDFGVGAMRWRLRVEAYMLLMVDDYPPSRSTRRARGQAIRCRGVDTTATPGTHSHTPRR
jgi:hypothetical protein